LIEIDILKPMLSDQTEIMLDTQWPFAYYFFHNKQEVFIKTHVFSGYCDTLTLKEGRNHHEE